MRSPTRGWIQDPEITTCAKSRVGRYTNCAPRRPLTNKFSRRNTNTPPGSGPAGLPAWRSGPGPELTSGRGLGLRRTHSLGNSLPTTSSGSNSTTRGPAVRRVRLSPRLCATQGERGRGHPPRLPVAGRTLSSSARAHSHPARRVLTERPRPQCVFPCLPSPTVTRAAPDPQPAPGPEQAVRSHQADARARPSGHSAHGEGGLGQGPQEGCSDPAPASSPQQGAPLAHTRGGAGQLQARGPSTTTRTPGRRGAKGPLAARTSAPSRALPSPSPRALCAGGLGGQRQGQPRGREQLGTPVTPCSWPWTAGPLPQEWVGV